MSPLLPIGLAIALNAAVLGAGTIWLRRQAKRVAAERAIEYRDLFRLEPLPPAGDEVQILAEDDDGVYELDAMHWPSLGWTDARTLLKVEDDVLGWRRHPFRREPLTVDSNSSLNEELAAEMARRFGDAEDTGDR